MNDKKHQQQRFVGPAILFILVLSGFLRADALSSSISMPSSWSSTSSSTSTTTTFYVLRHGETDANAAGIIQGSLDLSRLTAKGQRQASEVGSVALNPAVNHLGIRPIDKIYVSPLTRARDTLALVRAHAPPHMLPPNSSTDIVMPNLREIDFYSWEYQFKDELRQKYPDEYAAWKRGDPDGTVVDGRRPLREIWARANQVWKEVRDNDNNNAKLLVCHGTLGQALLGSAFAVEAEIFRRNVFPNCGMAEIVWDNDKDVATAWRWHYPTPTEFGCLREQLLHGGGIGLAMNNNNDKSMEMHK